MGRNGLMLEKALNRKRAFTPLEIKRSHRRSHKFLTGFTLIELMTTVVLVGAVFAAGITALTSIIRFYSIEQAKHRATDELFVALTWIEKDATQADQAVIDSDGNGNPRLTLRITEYEITDRPSYTIRYYLSADGGTLNRDRVHPTLGTETKQITDIIDSTNLPIYQSGGATLPDNYLFVDMHTKHNGRVAHHRMGIKLRGRTGG